MGQLEETTALESKIRQVEELMVAHYDYTDRNDEHKQFCREDNTPWPCPEFLTAENEYNTLLQKQRKAGAGNE